MSFKFNNHYKLKGLHAAFSPSQPSWHNYTIEKALEVYRNKQAAELGTRYHAWAAEAISLGLKQSKTKKTLNMYINDAIGYRMEPEVPLYYSDKFFGTADAICFRNGLLRIHDLKTGKGAVDIRQLISYAALFCLEYKIKPGTIEMELRIYQNDEVVCHVPEVDEIVRVMDQIVRLDEALGKEEV